MVTMASELFDILADKHNTEFKATTAQLAKVKFQRLCEKYPGFSEYGDCLLNSAKDLANEVEYDKFLCWLSNPSERKGERNPDPSCTGEVIPKMPERKSVFSDTPTYVTEKQIKSMKNAVFIHVKNADDLEQEEEKVGA